MSFSIKNTGYDVMMVTVESELPELSVKCKLDVA